MPDWQRYWESRDRDFWMIAVAQDAQGEKLVGPVVQERSIRFPVLVDHRSRLARILGFRIVPSGFFIDSEGMVRYRHTDDFDIGDPRLRVNLDNFLAGGEVKPIPECHVRMDPRALDLFAQGASLYAAGRERSAVSMWRRALELDPDNFVIRSQIWSVEHPEHFYPVVDRSWQALQLLKEGYDKPLP